MISMLAEITAGGYHSSSCLTRHIWLPGIQDKNPYDAGFAGIGGCVYDDYTPFALLVIGILVVVIVIAVLLWKRHKHKRA